MTTPAAEVAAAVLVLLRKGRVAPALLQLERLPQLIRDKLLDRVVAGTAGLGSTSWRKLREALGR
jgi:hypothetical protein